MNEFITRVEAGERLKRGGWQKLDIHSSDPAQDVNEIPCEIYERKGWLAFVTDEGVQYYSPKQSGLKPG